jgi:hypothetical protein
MKLLSLLLNERFSTAKATEHLFRDSPQLQKRPLLIEGSSFSGTKWFS